MVTLNGPEDGGIGALIVAIVWIIVEWFKHRYTNKDANISRKN
jgi:hypothetical protein